MLSIPEDKLPQEFKDEERLDSLFSPFRSRSVNPRDWDTKIASWKQLIALYCVNNGVYSFNLAKLNKLFIHHGHPPRCLAVVLEELVKSGDLQYLENFIKEPPKSWGQWATDLLIKKPVSWSYNSVKRSLFSSQADADRVYVHIEVIRGEAPKILSTIPGKYRNKVMNLSEFLELIGRDLSQSEDVKMLLYYLVQEKKADMKSLKKNDVDLESVLIKIGDENKVAEISEADFAVRVLEQNEKLFTKCIEDLEDDIMRCNKDAKDHLLNGRRVIAKTCLRKKYEIQKRLTNKINALHNIQVLLERLKDVHYDAEVWQSYKQALSAFNTTVKETGLNEDSIDDTMLKLGEMFDLQEDLQNAISKPVVIEDEDLEDELIELLMIEEERRNKHKEKDASAELEEQLAKLNISDLPEVPSANVSVQEPQM